MRPARSIVPAGSPGCPVSVLAPRDVLGRQSRALRARRPVVTQPMPQVPWGATLHTACGPVRNQGGLATNAPTQGPATAREPPHRVPSTPDRCRPDRGQAGTPPGPALLPSAEKTRLQATRRILRGAAPRQHRCSPPPRCSRVFSHDPPRYCRYISACTTRKGRAPTGRCPPGLSQDQAAEVTAVLRSVGVPAGDIAPDDPGRPCARPARGQSAYPQTRGVYDHPHLCEQRRTVEWPFDDVDASFEDARSTPHGGRSASFTEHPAI